jgi:hypothetical protein
MPKPYTNQAQRSFAVMPGQRDDVAMVSPLHPVILAGLLDSFDEPRLVDRRPPRRPRSLRARRRRVGEHGEMR